MGTFAPFNSSFSFGLNFGNNPEDYPSNASNKSQNDTHMKILLSAIVSLSVVVLLVIALHLYARCLMRRRTRRMGLTRSLGLTIGPVQSSQEPKRGLDPLVISSLPIFVYKELENHKSDDESTECAVCLSLVDEHEMVRLLPNCKHIFHAVCIDKWLTSRPTCPVCRTEAEPRVLPLLQEGPIGGTSFAPPLDMVNFGIEGTSEGQTSLSTKKVSGASSSSRMSSFRRMLSRGRSLSRIQSEFHHDHEVSGDIERQ